MAIGLKVQVNGPNWIDATNDVLSLKITWPTISFGGVPSCDIVLSNRQNYYSNSLAIFSKIQVTLPNYVSVGLPFAFVLEDPEFIFNPKTTVNGGRTVQLHGTACPELLVLSEGNLDVVGTDTAVYAWNGRSIDVQSNSFVGNPYIPYASTFVGSIGTPLLDIGTMLTQLLGNNAAFTGNPTIDLPNGYQPGQLAGYRGRLGYDATGAGIHASDGIFYNGGNAIGYYIKGQWRVGTGATGAQKAGLDLINEALSKNVIDSNGNNIVLDAWISALSVQPQQLYVFPRGTQNSNFTFTRGLSSILETDLPYSTSDIMNFIIYWANDELVYPNGGDNWSNYSTTPSLNSQWQTGVLFQGVNIGSILTQETSTFTPYSSGFSNQYSGIGFGQYLFNLIGNGYATLTSSFSSGGITTGIRNIQSLNFFMYTDISSANVQFILYDQNGNSVISPVQQPTTAQIHSWNQYSIPIPPTPPSGGTAGRGVW